MSLDFLEEMERPRCETDYAMSLEEIAEIEGITPQRVGFIIRHALRKLRKSGGPALHRMREAAADVEQRRKGDYEDLCHTLQL